MSSSGAAPVSSGHAPDRRGLEPAQWRQLALITGSAVVIFFGLRWLPTGTNLSHMDFRVDPRGASSIEYCDPLNPQFIPVVAVRSPVAMTVTPLKTSDAAGGPMVAGRASRLLLTLRTASGKPIAPEDLLVVHTRKLHLLIVDATLQDYQHVHPEPAAKPGEWTFAFTPQRNGVYRVFGDFTPAATSRGLYASADLAVQSGGSPERGVVPPPKDFRFTLTPSVAAIRAGQPVDLKFEIERTDGGPVPLQPVMGAFAHLVAFDESRSGFAHLHPVETDLLKPPHSLRPQMNFKLTIPTPGKYVIWAQVNLGGGEAFVPFWFDVL